MNAPIRGLVQLLGNAGKSRRPWPPTKEQFKRAADAVAAEVERINAEWRALPEEEKQRRLYPPRKSNVQFDRDRDLDERGISAADAWTDEHPLQSSATGRRY